MRYCLYAQPQWLIQSYGLSPNTVTPIKHLALPRVMHSGLVNWMKVLEGVACVPANKEMYEAVDVINVNLPTRNIGCIKKIHQHLRDLQMNGKAPMVIANPDYAVEMWWYEGRIDLFLKDINLADKIFCVHPAMSETLEVLLEKQVWTIPHPTDVQTLRTEFFEKRYSDPFNFITVLVLAHSYDRNYIIPTEVVQTIQNNDAVMRTAMVGKVGRDSMYLKDRYDEYYEAMPFPDLMNLISRADVVIDTSFFHSYGRVPVECAAVGTPCITHNTVYSGKLLFPEYQCDIMDGKQLFQKINQVLFNEPPSKSTRETYSKEAEKHFGYETSRRKFTKMVEEVI